MKIKFVKIDVGEKLLYEGKEVKVGDVIDLPKERADYYIGRGKAEKVRVERAKSKSESKETKSNE
ncbi:hypothetical protein [Bacillus andreraoultii]|uniref:hypothetical protein n=1 Tax=Bacillus andreraoultii TaxID=1499685 RepID=UPI00053975AD|nr:hypothetical protein [Bacillus andreraoultii]